jgi:hypothetical protein
MLLSACEELLQVRSGPEIDAPTDPLQGARAVHRVWTGSRIGDDHSTASAVVVLGRGDLVNSRAGDSAARAPLALEDPEIPVQLAKKVPA